MVFAVGQADPEFEVEGICNFFSPVLAEGLAGESADRFVGECAEAAWVVGVAVAELPCGNLIFDRCNHRVVVMHIGILIEDGESALMGQEVGEICLSDREIFPDLSQRGVFIQAVIGKSEQQACRGWNFGSRVNRDEGALSPLAELFLFAPTGCMA